MLTADLIDQFGADLQSCETQLRPFGRCRNFHGPVRTVRACDDNALVREILSTPGAGAVLVIDGSGSLRTALLGDQLAQLAQQNGWAGIIVHGAVRDSVALGTVDLGIKALGTNPRKSAKQRLGECDVTVSFGGAAFSPGNWVYCDDDGIVVSVKPLG